MGLKTARRTGAPLRVVVAPWEQVVREARYAHDGWEVDLRWGLRENSEIEGRETVSRRVAALGACDPAPSLAANADENCQGRRFCEEICYRIVDGRIEITVGSHTIYGICSGFRANFPGKSLSAVNSAL
jgi:hypothetical protein